MSKAAFDKIAAGLNEAALVAPYVAEIERLREALTPSGATKAAYGGEFTFRICISDDDGEDIHDIVTVPWTTIKEIMAAILARAALEPKDG